MQRRAATLPIVIAALAALAPSVGAAGSPAPATRWTDETPDAMIDRALERATRADGGSATEARAARSMRGSERGAMAAIAAIAELADRAGYGHAREALESIAKVTTLPSDVRAEAELAARGIASDEGTEAGIAADRKLGVVTELAVLGPFRDTGGGLDAKDGPEAPGASFADASAKYSWGAFDVAWRTAPRAFAGADGLPLDVLVHPRKESCTWVATKIALPRATAMIVRLAASGQARLMVDGAVVGKSDDVNASARFDRIAARVDAASGGHLVAAKVCAGALSDDGRARIVVTDDAGESLAQYASADLRGSIAVKTPARAKRNDVEKHAPPKSIATPLARTLAVPAKPSVDDALAAATLRTLGGADDMRSPRAPGALSAIAARGDLTPDALAMVGWIAPSGANRSSWLDAARDRAQAAKDDRTRAFAERRLVAQRVNGALPDWAMATLLAMPKANDAEMTLLHAVVDEALGSDALRAEAMRDLAAAFRAAPTRVPTSIVMELAQTATALDPARAREAREELARRGDRGAAWVAAEATRGAKEASDAARVAFETAGIDSSDEAIEVARSVSKAGAHDAARAIFGALVTLAPNRAEAWSGLADEMAAASDAAQSETAIRAALRRARDLAPGEARYREELALRNRDAIAGPHDADAHDDEKYLVSSQSILERRKGVPTGAGASAPDVADRQLHWVRAVLTHPDHRVSMLVHYAREIVVPPRTQEELYEELPIEADLVEILRARVHRKDGGTAFPAEEHNEGTRPRIRWPELEAGDVVEVAMREWTRGPVGGRGDFPFYFMDYAGGFTTHPNLYNEVVVETLPGQPLYLDVLQGGDYRRTEKDENGKHVVRLVWDHPPTFPDEPLSPAESEIVPMVVGSTFKSWADLRAWYGEAVKGFTEPDDEVRKLARDLTKGKTTRDAKLEAIFDFVADDIRYVNYTSGEWWLPNRPQQLLARREGDCDDKAILLITLLKSVGIDAQEVMVQTRQTGEPAIVLAKGAAIPLFDHGIAYLPGPNGGTYLDATSPQSRLGPLPSMDAKAVALRMDAGPSEIVRLPASNPDEHGASVMWTITLHPDGSGDLVGEERHVGDGAFWLRTELEKEGARQNYVESSLLGDWFPTVVVSKDIDFNGDLPKGEAWVRYRAKSDGLARKESGELAVPIARAQSLASQIAPLVTRTLPVQLPPYFAPSHETRTLRIIAPPGWTWSELPTGGDANGGDFGRAHLAVDRDPKDPHVVVVTRSVSFDLDRIPVERYGAWRAWVQSVDALMNNAVRLTKETK